jgi:hypothetical protein
MEHEWKKKGEKVSRERMKQAEIPNRSGIFHTSLRPSSGHSERVKGKITMKKSFLVSAKSSVNRLSGLFQFVWGTIVELYEVIYVEATTIIPI